MPEGTRHKGQHCTLEAWLFSWSSDSFVDIVTKPDICNEETKAVNHKGRSM